MQGMEGAGKQGCAGEGMTVTTHSRGHLIYWDTNVWRYRDDDTSADVARYCIRCGRMPTPEGYDACLGYIEGANSACCGHGIESGYIDE